MSAAFQLDFSGAPVPCGYPRCILGAFHDGDHEFPLPTLVGRDFDQHCVVCGRAFTVYGAEGQQIFKTCGSSQCVLHFAKHGALPVAVMCRCPQREHPHELTIHAELKSESYNPRLRYQWPWSLMLSRREEPSTEALRRLNR